jgi:hypothetical protein
MKIIYIIFLWCTLVGVGLKPLIAQQNQQNDGNSEKKTTPEPVQLPQLKLQEYTITGLSKITLPQKIRAQIFKKIDISWNKNPQLFFKESPTFLFGFSRIKPAFFRLHDFPRLNSQLYYGTFDEFGLKVSSQMTLNSFQPYISGDYGQSEGHRKNAQWKQGLAKAGFHQQLTKGHLLHGGVTYQRSNRGIWKDWQIFQQNWETQTTLAKSFVQLEQDWTSTFATKIGGNYYFDDHQNAFKYSDRGFDFSGEIILNMGSSSLKGRGEYEKEDIQKKPGNLTDHEIESSRFNQQIVSGSLIFEQDFGPISAKFGGIIQQVEEAYGSSNHVDSTYIYPYGALTIGLGEKASASLIYHPKTQIFRMRSMVSELPFSDVQEISVVNYYFRIEPSLFLQPFPNFKLNLSADLAGVRNYSAPIYMGDLDPNFLPYPSWNFGILNDIELQEIKGKLDWAITPWMEILGWINLRHSKIKKFQNMELDISGKQIPYLPSITSNGSLTVKPWKMLEIRLFGEYVGKRYDDIVNFDELEPFFLFNARIEIGLRDHFRIYTAVQNMFNKQYQRWSGFIESGTIAIAGFRLVY